MIFWFKILLTIFFVAISALYFLIVLIKKSDRLKWNIIIFCGLVMVLGWTTFEVWQC